MKTCTTILLIVFCLILFTGIGNGRNLPRRFVPYNYRTIQSAIDASSHGDTIIVSEGTYRENINFQGKRILVASLFFVDGDTSHISRTVISGAAPADPDEASVVRFVSGEDTNSVLCGFLVRDGKGSRISDNDYEGGGILCRQSGARLVSNIISANTVTGYNLYGGGVSASGDGTHQLIMKNNVVIGNVLDGNLQSAEPAHILPIQIVQGGGISLRNMNAILEKNIIQYNSAVGEEGFGSSYGGGISLTSDNVRHAVVVFGNFIADNKAVGLGYSNGGGLHVYNEHPRIVNNVIVRNTCLYGGGVGLQTDLAPGAIGPVLINNTIADNEATGGPGGGMYLRGCWTPVVMNSIVWGNKGIEEIAPLEGSSIHVFYSDIRGGWPLDSGNFHADPLFEVGGYRPIELSLCIGAGTALVKMDKSSFAAPEYDFSDVPRPQPLGSNPDVGAFEHACAGVNAKSMYGSVSRGWNLLSVPLEHGAHHPADIYPTASGKILCYEAEYMAEDSIKFGCGHWARFTAPTTIYSYGEMVDEDTIALIPGWNLLGTISEVIAVEGIISDPPGLLLSRFFGYADRYVGADSLMPGKGYWVKSEQAGKLILEPNDADDVLSKTGRIKIVAGTEQPPPPPGGEITDFAPQLPNRFALGQNYPNPFNPSTVIRYQLPVNSWVTLTVFDVLGREVATLVDESKNPGEYTQRWSAEGLPSGMYFYKMTAGSFSEIKKLMFVK